MLKIIILSNGNMMEEWQQAIAVVKES